VEGARELVAHDPNDVSAKFSLAIALFCLSLPLRQRDPTAALAAARESVRVFDEQIDAGKKSFLIVSRRARAMRRLSEALLATGQANEARATIAEALAEQRSIAARDKQDLHEATLVSMMLVTAAQAADGLRDGQSAAGYRQEAEQISAGVYSQGRNELSAVIPLAQVREALRP
jgi:hypothetical protein